MVASRTSQFVDRYRILLRPRLVEVKYRRHVGDRDARTLIGEGGVLVSRALDGDFAEGAVCALPVADALALLDAPALGPVRC